MRVLRIDGFVFVAGISFPGLQPSSSYTYTQFNEPAQSDAETSPYSSSVSGAPRCLDDVKIDMANVSDENSGFISHKPGLAQLKSSSFSGTFFPCSFRVAYRRLVFQSDCCLCLLGQAFALMKKFHEVFLVLHTSFVLHASCYIHPYVTPPSHPPCYE